MRLVPFLLLLGVTAYAQPCTGITTTFNKASQTKWFEKMIVSNGLPKDGPIRKITVNRGVSTTGATSDNYAFLWFEVFTDTPKWSVDTEATLFLSDDTEISLPISLKPKLAGKQFYSSSLLTLYPDRVEELREKRIVKVKLHEIEFPISEALSRKIKEDLTCIAEAK